MGRTLILLGAALIAVGLFMTFGERLPLRLGRLPNGGFYFPVVTCLVLSAIFSLVMWLFGRRP